MRRPKFRQLEAFQAVMLAGSVSKAAQMLSVSQPGVSRLIADLEQTLGLRLFNRNRGRLAPTPEAELLFQDAQMAFAGIEMVSEAAVALRSLRRGRIRVVSETVYAEGYLPRLIARYQKAHSEVAVELDIGPSARAAHWVSARWYDVGLVVLPVAEPEVALHKLRTHEAVCVLNADHPLAAKHTITAGELAGEAFVSLVPGSPFRASVDRAFERGRARRTIRTEARTQHAICALVAEGAGLSVVDPCVAEDVHDRRLAFRRFRPSILWELGLLLPAARAPSLIAQDFVAFIQQNAAP